MLIDWVIYLNRACVGGVCGGCLKDVIVVGMCSGSPCTECALPPPIGSVGQTLHTEPLAQTPLATHLRSTFKQQGCIRQQQHSRGYLAKRHMLAGASKLSGPANA